MKFEGAGKRDFEWPASGDSLQEGKFVPGHFAALCAISRRRHWPCCLRASARPFPFEVHFVRDEAFDGVSHVCEPGAAAHFAIGKNVDAELTLLFECSSDGAVFLVAKFFERELSLAYAARAFKSSGGRSKLPTCSAR